MPEDRVWIFDTTLRDGEQSPGAAMTAAEKLEVARGLARLGVDVIEAGFPAASPDDLAAVKSIAEQVGQGQPGPSGAPPPIICGLARASQNDIDKAWDAVQKAARPRIHTFLAASDVHLEHKLRMTRFEALGQVRRMVEYARSLCSDVEFSPEDAGRSDPRYLYQVLEAAIEAGATTLNIPDTVGYTTPDEFGGLIAGIRANVRGIDSVIISVHCHDDLGLAVANTMAGLRAGARQAEVTVNGIGERAGNCALEELVMALETRRATLGMKTGIDTTQLGRLSRLVSACSGMVVAPNKAIVGANAFAHESGIHQDGMLKHHATYEIMRPETVGAPQTQLVLGKHSGRHALSMRLRELGYELGKVELDRAFTAFKTLADKKKHIIDADLEALVSDEIRGDVVGFQLEALQVACGTIGMATATVRIVDPQGTSHVRAAVGTGPIDAVYKAIDEVAHVELTLVEYSVRAITEGIDALGEVSVKVRAAGKVIHGHGADTDIVVASAKAYLAAVNRVVAMVAPRAAEAGVVS